ncbi:MAG: CDP-glucose 4,6-dehydratase [Eubacterium sp.]|nr:CDP-glucose 4,6-dehydratase [Eubacterium sp.]
MNLSFYNNKKVLVTGHTGFKGTWLCKILINAGAQVVGYSLEPPTNPSVFELSGIEKKMKSYIADIRDLEKLNKVFEKEQPEIVFHLAAQPIVRDSYKMPVYTYETNVIGTVNICECVRLNPCVKSFLNVTTDKVYENDDLDIAFKEDMPLDGYDPYSNSKSCSELVTHSYKKSFFCNMDVAVSTARAGNVIGGGDFANDRIIPDCIRAVEKSEEIIVRNPYSTRPYQHVLEPLKIYLMIAEGQYKNRSLEGYYNVGPNETDCRTTGNLVTLFCNCWGESASWKDISQKNAPHEASFLRLDTTKVKETFGWKPVWSVEQAIEKIVEWTKVYFSDGSVSDIMDKQINEFFNTED